MKFTRVAGTALLLFGIAVGTSACMGEDGSITLPDRENLPSITLPTRPPAPEAEAPPAAEPDQPAAEPEAPPAAEPEAPAAEEEAIYDEDRGTRWPLIVIVILGIGAVLATRLLGAARRDWTARLSAVRTDIAWVETSLVPQVLASTTTAEAAALWAAARPRVLEIDQRLHTLESEAKDDAAVQRVTRLRAPFGSLVTAITAETSTTAAALADELRASRIQVELARQAVRASLAGD